MMFERIETAAGPALLKRTSRRTLAISVLPDGKLELVAPARTPIPAILNRVEKRLGWICQQRKAFREWTGDHTRLRYRSGATHRYLGRQYRLKVSEAQQTHVALIGGYFHVAVPAQNEALIRGALEAWYRKRAYEQFERRVAAWKEWCRTRGLPVPQMHLRSMPKRWGSAQSNGTIYLNPELIRASSACIDYVITHEICHLRHPNHGPKFRTLLQMLCPEHESLKTRLEQTH